MYYDYPEQEEAYHSIYQYMFGSELLAAPFVFPRDKILQRTRQVIWLPEGEWFHFFTGQYYQGGKWMAEYGKLSDIPVLARAGAIVPLGPKAGWGGIANPDRLDLFVFPGRDNTFELYEDDGHSQQYQNGAWALTPFEQRWESNRLCFTVKPVSGDRSVVPPERTYTFYFRGIVDPERVHITLNQQEQALARRYDPETETFILESVRLKPADRLVIEVATAETSLLSKKDRRRRQCQELITGAQCESLTKAQLLDSLDKIIRNVGMIGQIKMRPSRGANRPLELDAGMARSLIEIITGQELFSNFDE